MRQAKPSTPRKGKRIRGYQIHIWRGARYQPPSLTTPLMWRASPPVDEWQRVITDPPTQQAWIIRSGRKMKEFQFQRNANSEVRS